MEETYVTHSAEETRDLGGKLAQGIAPGTLVCLEGDLGSGKTTFAQGFLEGMSAIRPYVSPTYIIMKQHDLPAPTARGIQRIYHVDAYRVETKDLIHLGFAEWCADKEGVVILEWPERAEELIPKNAIHITFLSKSENEREITFSNNHPK